MEEKFKSILKENEKVIFVTNATKANIYPLSIFIFVISFILFGALFIPISILFNLCWLNAIYVLLVLFNVAVTITFRMKFVRNYFICLTDKRVIIRKGIFTTDYEKFSIENVSGNIEVKTNQSVFDRANEGACDIHADIELLPVGHGKLNIWTSNINNGLKFSELLEEVVKNNAKKQNIIKE